MSSICFPESDYNVGIDPFTVMTDYVKKKLTEKGYFAYKDERDDCVLTFESIFIPDFQQPADAINAIKKGRLRLFKHDSLREYIQDTARHMPRSWTILNFVGQRPACFDNNSLGEYRAVVTVVACYAFGAVHLGKLIQTARRSTSDPQCATQREVLAAARMNCGMFLNLLNNKDIFDRTEDYFTRPSHSLPGLICCYMSRSDELQGTFNALQLPEIPSVQRVIGADFQHALETAEDCAAALAPVSCAL